MSHLEPKDATEERPDALIRVAQHIQRRPALYLGVIALVLASVIGVQIASSLASEDGEDYFSPVWDAYSEVRGRVTRNLPATAELARLDQAAEAARGSKAEASALWLSALGHYASAFTKDKFSFEDRKPGLEAARDALTKLKGKQFDYFPPSLEKFFTSAGAPPVDEMHARVVADLNWVKENAHGNPEPDEAPTAVLRTDSGDIHLRFFSALAPKHVENFVMLARAGAYNGTAFHFVRGSESPIGISGGDPLSYFYNDPLKKIHILRWGHGGTGYDIPPEASRYRISHKRGIVTAQRRGIADWDNGAQFQILVDTDRDLDRSFSPFAEVVEGIEIADKIAKSPTAGSHGPFRDSFEFGTLATLGLVVEPVWIQKVIIYNKAGEALEHSYPITDGEKKLSTLSASPLKPLSESELSANRKLVVASKTPTFRRGLDIPFPTDLSDPSAADPAGERRVAKDVSATGQDAPDKDSDSNSSEGTEKSGEDGASKDSEGADDSTKDAPKGDG